MMYMIYNMQDFRRNLRNAFDLVASGEEVLVDRLGILFKLEAHNFKPLVPLSEVSSIPEIPANSHSVMPVGMTPPGMMNVGKTPRIKPTKTTSYFCKTHGLPTQPGKKTCMMKGCK